MKVRYAMQKKEVYIISFYDDSIREIKNILHLFEPYEEFSTGYDMKNKKHIITIRKHIRAKDLKHILRTMEIPYRRPRKKPL